MAKTADQLSLDRLERLSECVNGIFKKLNGPEFKSEILSLRDDVAAKLQGEKEYKSKRWRTRVRYFGRYIATDARLRVQDFTDLIDTHQYRGFPQELPIQDEDELLILVFPLRDYLTMRFHPIRMGGMHVSWNIEIEGWIPNRLTEEGDDPKKSFYFPDPILVASDYTKKIGREFTRLELLTTLVLVCEAMGNNCTLLPEDQQHVYVDTRFTGRRCKIQALAEREQIDVPTLEAWLDAIDPSGDAGVESVPCETGVAQSNSESEPIGGDPKAQSILRPPENAFKAWRLRDLEGIVNQTELAARLTKEGVSATQGQVSRWLKQVDEYLKAGNALPAIKPLTSKPDPIDPNTLNMGQRQDGRTPRQRHSRSPDSE